MSVQKMIDRMMLSESWKIVVGGGISATTSAGKRPEDQVFLLVSPALAVSMFERSEALLSGKSPLLLVVSREECSRYMLAHAVSPQNRAGIEYNLAQRRDGYIIIMAESSIGYRWRANLIADFPAIDPSLMARSLLGDDGKTEEERAIGSA